MFAAEKQYFTSLGCISLQHSTARPGLLPAPRSRGRFVFLMLSPPRAAEICNALESFPLVWRNGPKAPTKQRQGKQGRQDMKVERETELSLFWLGFMHGGARLWREGGEGVVYF